MNLTLGTLAALKTWLLPEQARTSTQWDAAIAAIGLGVARAFERHTGRQFARLVNSTWDVPADTDYVILPRLPVETVARADLRAAGTASWVEAPDLVQGFARDAGLVLLTGIAGARADRLRITYTGGYWVAAEDDLSAEPSLATQQGSTALAAAAEAVAVAFGAAFSAVPVVLPVVVPPPGGVMIAAVPESISASGFTARLSFPIPGPGYALQWVATNAAQQGTVALAVGAETLPLSYDLPFTAPPAVNLSVTPPPGGVLLTATPESISSSGFTARLSAPVPAPGYALLWNAASPSIASPSGGVPPVDAVPVPDDLRLAWLQQCAHAWSNHDKLGAGLAAREGAAPSTGAELLPGVVAALSPYRRFLL